MIVEPVYRYRATCRRVIDGDTLELDVDLGFRVRARLLVRVHGVDAPEMDTPAGIAARAAVLHYLTDRQLVIASYRDRQSFERWVADVYVVGGDSLAAWIIAQGHGVAA